MALMDLMPLIGAALAAGFASAPHCAAMCGPLALSSCGSRAAPAGAYLTTRTLSYALAGAAAGAVGGRFVRLLDRAQVHYLAAGLAALAIVWQAVRLLRPEAPRAALTPLRTKRGGGVTRGAGMGALTALLPCGASASALLLAASAASAVGGAVVMSLFALASAPGLLAAVFAGGLASRVPFRLPRTLARRVLGVVLVVLAGWTVARPFRVARHGCRCHDRGEVSRGVEGVRQAGMEVMS